MTGVDLEMFVDSLESKKIRSSKDPGSASFDGVLEAAEFGPGVKVVRTGKVKVKEPFTVEEFDEDDGWVRTAIKPGIYVFRVLDFRGWKPRQLSVDGEWLDVAGECAELEELLGESTGVSDVAPTVDYLGHVDPVGGIKGRKLDSVPDYNKKAVDKFYGDGKLIGRILAGEPVRDVIMSFESPYDVPDNPLLDPDYDPVPHRQDPDEVSDMRQELERDKEFRELADSLYKIDSISGLSSYKGDLEVTDPLVKMNDDPEGYYFIVRDPAFRDADPQGLEPVLYVNVWFSDLDGVKDAGFLVDGYFNHGGNVVNLVKDLKKMDSVKDVSIESDFV